MIIEVCAGSLQDCLVAQRCGAHRIELNTALHLGGLTASVAVLEMAKECVDIPIMCMVRPRGAGFCYDAIEKEVMLKEAELLLKSGADGIVFGCLDEQRQIDVPFTQQMVALIQSYHKTAVFHRAFDVVADVYQATEQLIELGVYRILTSGTKANAWEGRVVLKALHQRFGKQIDFCMGAGISGENILPLVKETGILQCHASFKGWYVDKTTAGNAVNYSYGVANCYDKVDENVLQCVMKTIKGVGK